MAKTTPKPTMKNGARSDAAKLIKPTFSDAEIKRFRAIKTGADILALPTSVQRKYTKWANQKDQAAAKRFIKKQYGW